jgi:hypothetical protein
MTFADFLAEQIVRNNWDWEGNNNVQNDAEPAAAAAVAQPNAAAAVEQQAADAAPAAAAVPVAAHTAAAAATDADAASAEEDELRERGRQFVEAIIAAAEAELPPSRERCCSDAPALCCSHHS